LIASGDGAGTAQFMNSLLDGASSRQSRNGDLAIDAGRSAAAAQAVA
jgi:hypothetical protein